MKKMILLAAGVIFLAAAHAQDRKGQHPKGKMKGQHEMMMMNKLNLTEAQKSQMKTINEDFRKQMTELKKNEDITVRDWKSKMNGIREEHKARIQALLTSDQKAQIEKMRAEHKAMQDKDAKARMEKMKTQLDLTENQVAQLAKNRSEMEQKMKAIRENKSLDETAKKEQIKELMKSNKEKMKSIFTEEQLKKMKERKEMHQKMNGDKREKKETI
jgi:Spy/CpxP family protein refolding chaperone